MKTPNFINEQFVDKTGHLTPAWQTVISTLISQLQQNFSAEGLMSPIQTTANINLLADPEKNGALFYDSDTNNVKVVINGAIKTVTTS